MWEFTNFDVEDWIASYFPREHYISKRYRRLVLEMRETLKTVGIKTLLGPGINIVDLRDRFYVTMSTRASLRFLLPIAHMLGFLDDNFALTSQYKDGRFQIQHRVHRMSLVWVKQPGLPLRVEIAPTHGTVQGIRTPDLFQGWTPFLSNPIWTASPCSMVTRKAGIYVKLSPRKHLTCKKRSGMCTFSSWSNTGSNSLKLL